MKTIQKTAKLRFPMWLKIALFGLPLTHAPTIDMPFRWRISEIVAWIMAPAILFSSWRFRNPITRIFILAMAIYVSYTAILGMVMAWFVPVEVSAALEGTVSTVLRTLLESARLIGSLVMVKAVCRYASASENFERVVRAIIVGGIFLFCYTVYEILVLYLGLGLPLLPGSRSIPGFPVAATMYEPSSAGTYGAATALLSTSLLAERSRGKVVGVIGLIAGILTVVLTTSRTGVASFAIGTITLVLLLALKGRLGVAKVISLGVVASLTVWGGVVLGQHWLEKLFYNRFNLYSVQYYMKVRSEEIYSRLIHDLLDWPLGLGQGLWLFLVGGGASAPRLVVEGGFIGLFFLGVMLVALLAGVWQCFVLLREGLPGIDGIIAAVVATIVSLYNYVNVSDAWIWVVLSLPLAALETERRRMSRTKTVIWTQERTIESVIIR